jgi:integrase/recombinase XerD
MPRYLTVQSILLPAGNRLETTARYSRVAIGLIAKIESPLEGLGAPRRRRAKRDREEPPAP